ncbi:hypothetical protein HPP92_020099, partial [Vanilla planifolia]
MKSFDISSTEKSADFFGAIELQKARFIGGEAAMTFDSQEATVMIPKGHLLVRLPFELVCKFMSAAPITFSLVPFGRSAGIGLRQAKNLVFVKFPSSVHFRPSAPQKSFPNLHVKAAMTESSSVSRGTGVPHFELSEPLTGKVLKLTAVNTIATGVSCHHGVHIIYTFTFEVMFLCNHCPFVKHLKKGIVKLTNNYMEKGLAVVAISSNSTLTHPQDGPDFMAEEAKKHLTFHFHICLMSLKMQHGHLELFAHRSFFFTKRKDRGSLSFSTMANLTTHDQIMVFQSQE